MGEHADDLIDEGMSSWIDMGGMGRRRYTRLTESRYQMATKYTPLPAKETQIVTPKFRISFPSVFEPKYNQLAEKNQYTLVMLFPKTDKVALKPMMDLMARVAEHRFGKGAKGLKNPFKDGDTAKNQAEEFIKEKNPAYEGQMVLSSWSKNKPGVVNSKNQIILDHDEIYGGCYCRAQLNCYAYEVKGNRGIAFGLMHVQKLEDGDPFGARTRVEDAFSPVDGEGSQAEDSPAGGGKMFD